MTSKEILSSFSQTLLQDERILSVQERELLSNLLEHARTKSEIAINGSVAEVIAHAIGETVAQRAFTVLGGQIVEQILGDRPLAGEKNSSVAKMLGGPRPPSPSPGPGALQTQRMSSGPRPPSPAPGPGRLESQRMSSGPRPPKAAVAVETSNNGQAASVAVLESLNSCLLSSSCLTNSSSPRN